MSKIYRSNRKDYSVSGKVTSINGNSHIKRGVLKGKGLKQRKENSSLDNKGNIFGFIIFCLIFIILGNYLRTGVPFDLTFKGFIEYLSNAPSFDMSWSMVDLTIYGDWGIFNGLKDFFNWFTDVWEVCITLFGMVIELIEFVFYFAKGLIFS